MCGRVYNGLNPHQLLRLAGTTLMQNQDRYSTSYNIAPTTYIPAIRHCNNPENKNREVDMLKWGYNAPFEQQQIIINARVEDLQHKKTFKNLINTSRCVTIIQGYFEWTPNHEPYVFRRKPTEEGGDLPTCLYIASLIAPDGTVILLTRQALWEFIHVHERMPMVLDENEIDQWLDCENFKYEKIIGDITSPNNPKWSTLYHYQIGPLINNLKNKSDKNLMTLEEYKKDLDKTGIKSFFKPVKKNKEEAPAPVVPVVQNQPPFQEPAKEKPVEESKEQAANQTAATQSTAPPNIEDETTIAETFIEDDNEKSFEKLTISQEAADKLAMNPEQPVPAEEVEESKEDNPHLDHVKETINDLTGGFKTTNAFVMMGKAATVAHQEAANNKQNQRGKKRREPSNAGGQESLKKTKK